MLRKDKEEAEAIKHAKALEEEKAMYSVREACLLQWQWGLWEGGQAHVCLKSAFFPGPPIPATKEGIPGEEVEGS